MRLTFRRTGGGSSRREPVATTASDCVDLLAFAWFATSLSSYNRLYGSLGTLLLLLVWLNVNCFLLIIGFDLNTALNKAANAGVSGNRDSSDGPSLSTTD